MNHFRNLFLLLFLSSFSFVSAQELTLTRAESEAVFLKENIELLVARLEIDQAEADVIQAKLWPNPTLEIDEVNLWVSQLDVLGEELQGFNGGNFGKNQQIAGSVEQLFQLAGKRRKLIALEKVSVEKSKEYFEDLLRNLKLEFRNLLTDYQYLQKQKELFNTQLESVLKLTRAFKNQLDDGHISKGEYIRLKALELEIRKEIKENSEELNEVERDLKSLMHLRPDINLTIHSEGFERNYESSKLLSSSDLFEKAKESRPDFRMLALEKDYSDKNLIYEKAQRIPDVALKVGYDRGGNFMYNFVGFGFSMDLPLFNRNQGAIKHAQIETERVRSLNVQKELEIENEIEVAYKNFQDAVEFIESIEPDHSETLDLLFESYTQNLISRNLNLLEYLDFSEAYLENKTIIFEAIKDLNRKIEQLNYALGRDLF